MLCEFIGALEVTYGHALAGGGGFRRVTTPEGSAAELTPATFLWFKPTSNSTAPTRAVVHLHIGGEEPTDFPIDIPPPPLAATKRSSSHQASHGPQWVRMDKAIDRARALYVWYLAHDWRGPPTTPKSPPSASGELSDDTTALEALRPLKDIRVVRDVKDVPDGFECVAAPPLVTDTTDDKGKTHELRSYVCYKRLDDDDLSGSTWTLAAQKSGTWLDVRDLASNRWRVGQIVHVSANECRIAVATWSKKASTAFRDDVVSFAMSRNRVAPLGTHTELHLSPSYPLCRKQGSPWNLTLKDLEQARADFDKHFAETDTLSSYLKQRLLPVVEKSMVSLFYSNELAEQVSLFHQHVVKTIVVWFNSASGDRASANGDGTNDDQQQQQHSEIVLSLLSILRIVLSGMVAPAAAMFFYIKYSGSYATIKTTPTLAFTAYLTSTDAIAAAPMRHPCRSSFFVDVVDVFFQAGGFQFILERVGRRDVPLVEIAVLAMVLLSAKPCLLMPPKRKRQSSASSLTAAATGRRKPSLAPENQQLVEDFSREFLQSTLARLRRMKGEELKDEDGLVEHIVVVLDAIYRDGLFLGGEDLGSTPEGSSSSADSSPPSSSSDIAFAEVFEMFHLDLSKKYICCPFLAQRLLGVARLSDLISMAQRHDSLQKKTSFNLKRSAVGAAATAVSSLGLGGSSSSSDASANASTKWLRYKFIMEWLVDSDVVEVILGQKETCAKYGMREGIHLELLKRSRSLLEALTQSGCLTETHLSLVWKAAMGQLRTGRKAVLDLLIALCADMTADMLDLVMVLLTQVAASDYDELLLQFIQKLIEIAAKNAVDAENGAKKSTITSLVGVHSKRTQGAQRDSETSNKIVGLGLSLLWNAIEHHSSSGEGSADSDPSETRTRAVVTPALAVAFAESLNHVHRTWTASGLSSSSAKEQQQLLSQYVTKCVGLIKAGGALTEMAMVIIQKVVENYGRTSGSLSSSSTSTLAMARSTFQSGGMTSMTGPSTSSDLVKELQSKHSLVSLVVSEIERCVRDQRARQHSQKWQTEGSKPISTADVGVQKRLSFLAFIATSSSDLEISYKHIERLWVCFVKPSESQTKEDEKLHEEQLRDVFFNWLSIVIADPGNFVQRTYAGKHALTPATTEELFADLTASTSKSRTVELTIATMSPSAFWTFERLFRYVNVADKRMTCESSSSTTGSNNHNSSSHVVVESMELKGFERLFDIALSANPEVSAVAMNYLIHLHMRLGSKLVRREVWSDFARGCVARLSKMKASASDTSSNEEITRVFVLLNTLLYQSTVQEPDASVDPSSTLEDLTVYVRTQDGRAAAPFYFKLKRTFLVGELRDLIARDSSHPADRVRLINDRKVKLTAQGHDRVTLEKAQVIRANGVAVSSKAAIAVATTPDKRKNFVEAVLLNRPDSDTNGHVERPVLVGNDTGLSKEMNDWEAVKFELSSSKTLRSLQQFLSVPGDVSEEAWKLLKQLNYDSTMEKKIRTLDDVLNIDGSMKKSAAVQDWGKLLDATSPPRLLYQVELLERFALTKLPPSTSDGESDHNTPTQDQDDRAAVANTWSESFSSLGGQTHLKDFVLALNTDQLVAPKRSLTAMCLARVFGLLDHLILLDVQATQPRRDGSYESLMIKIFDALRTVQVAPQVKRTPESKADLKSVNAHPRVSIPTYERPGLRSSDDDTSNAISIEAMLLIGALRLLSTSALAHGEGLANDDQSATISLLSSFSDAGSILLKCLVNSPEEVVRKEAYRTIADLCSPLKNRRRSDRSQCRRFFLRLLAESEELALHAEYYELYRHLIDPPATAGASEDDDDDLTWFAFLPASVKLCRCVVQFPEAPVKQPSPSQHFKSSLLPAAKGKKKEPAPDAVYEVLLSTLLAVLRKIPPVLADGDHPSPTGEPQSLREVVVGTINAEEGIIEEIFTHGLFPANASVTGEKNEDDERSAQYYLKQPKCKSDSCRKVAFELLQELATESVDGLQYLFGQMTEHHSLTPPPDPSANASTLAAPVSISKKKTRPSVTKAALDYHNLERGKYVGLKNLGCTCYMNSTVQAFFMMPRLRRQLLRYASQPNGLVYQLQSVFAHLEGSAKAYYNPKALTQAMKTWEGEPIDVNEQQDASEFLTSFFQQIESEMNGRNEVAESPSDSGSGTLISRAATDESILNSFFGGVFSNELVAEGDRYSERFEPFHFISVPVRDRKNLQESLDSWAEGDKVSYTWESPATGDSATAGEVEKVTLDTHKRISIHKLPDQLIIHLKRFEFDFEAMQQTKIHDRFEFPMELDMYPYTKEGQAEQRSRKRSQSRSVREKSDASAVDTSNRSRAPEYYQYELVGTVVHMGTAHSGHYYSFMRDHDTSKSTSDGNGQSQQQQQWYEFNDTHVTPFDAADIPEECFGGQDDDRDDSAHAARKRKKTRSSFMLFYSRRQPKLQLLPTVPVATAPKPLSVYATVLCFIVRLKTRAHSRMEYLRSRSLILAPEPIREQILLENRMFWRKKYLFNRHYLDFTFQLLSACTSEPAHDGTVRFDGPIDVRLQALQLATRFVFGTLWQSGDIAAVLKWKPALCALYRDDVAGSQWLLSTLRENDALLLEFLVSNEHAEVRELMAVVLEEAIATTSHSAAIAISQNPTTPSGRSSSRRRRSSTTLPPSFEFLFLLYRLMPWLLTVPANQHQQYFEVLLTFALTGQNECTFTVVNSVVGAIGSLLTGVGATQPLLQGELKRIKGRAILKRIELEYVQLKLLSLLIRIVPPPAMDVPGTVLLPPSMAANPNAPSLPAGDHDVLLSERFITLLAQHASHYTKSTKSLEQIVMHLCWQSRRVTDMVMDVVMNGIEREDHDDVKPYFRTLNAIYKIKDSLAQERLEDGMTKLVAILASQQKYFKATEASIDMLTRLAKRHPRSVAQWIRKHHASCAWMEKWLLAHRGQEGYLQLGRTALVKPKSTSSWATVSVHSEQLVRNVDRSMAKLLPRVRSMLDAKDGMETFYDSDDNPARLVGKRVRVKWAKEKWYEGYVERFDERLYEHLIVYDDGDKRQYRMSDKVFYVVESSAPGASATTTPTPLRRRESSSADL